MNQAAVEIDIETRGSEEISMKPNYRLIYQQYLDNCFVDKNITFKVLDHEMKHLINSYHKKVTIDYQDNEKQYRLRTGLILNKVTLQRNRQPMKYGVVSTENRMLEEICNVVACQDTEPILFQLSQMPIRYLNIRKFFVEQINTNQISIYNLAIPSLRPILENIGRELEDTRYYGQVEQFKSYYNTICQSPHAFSNLSNSLDIFLDEMIAWEGNYEQYIQLYQREQLDTLRALKQTVKPFQKNFNPEAKRKAKR